MDSIELRMCIFKKDGGAPIVEVDRDGYCLVLTSDLTGVFVGPRTETAKCAFCVVAGLCPRGFSIPGLGYKEGKLELIEPKDMVHPGDFRALEKCVDQKLAEENC